MTELQRGSCELVVKEAVLKAIGISVNVCGYDDDGRIHVDLDGVPYEYRDRITEAVLELIGTDYASVTW